MKQTLGLSGTNRKVPIDENRVQIDKAVSEISLHKVTN